VADYAPSPEPIIDAAIKATQESRRRRREALIETIKKAGINPAEIDVTMLTSDEEQAKLLQLMAERNDVRLLAERFGREGLRARLKQTVETSTRNQSISSKNGVHKLNGAHQPTKLPDPDQKSSVIGDRPEDRPQV